MGIQCDGINQLSYIICIMLIVAELSLVDVWGHTGLNKYQVESLAKDCVVQAEVMDNLRDSGNTHKLRITLINKGVSAIPKSGWILYFHSLNLVFPSVFPAKRSKDLEIERIRVSMIQGDLYSMQPIAGFAALQPGGSREYELEVAWWSVSRSDFMPNWYLASTDQRLGPSAAFPLNHMNPVLNSEPLNYVKPFKRIAQWKRYIDDRYNPFSNKDRADRFYVHNSPKFERIIIPTPKTVIIASRGPTINVDTTWRIHAATRNALSAARILSALTNLQKTTTPGTDTITLNISSIGNVSEAYSIEIIPEQHTIVLNGHDEHGLFYAIQSLHSILVSYRYRSIPRMSILDEPRFQYRGMFLDVARNFHTVADVTRLMKVMAMYKLNKLHLHLSDNEGWRLDIPELPELTKIGGKRCHDLSESTCILPQYGSGPAITDTSVGYFTSRDYKHILNYALINHIEIIPAFEMPSNSHAAIVAMEARYRKFYQDRNVTTECRLKDPDDKSTNKTANQWTNSLINPCMPSTYSFIEKVIDHVAELHKHIQPLKTFHFGGWEVPKEAWLRSPICHEFLNRNPHVNTLNGIKRYFIQRVSNMTSARGIRLSGSEDAFLDNNGIPFSLTGVGNKEMSANSWNNVWEWGAAGRAYTLANIGYKVIMSQVTHLCFDHPYEPDPEEPGLYWATRFTDTLKTFSFLPESLYDNVDTKLNGESISESDVCGENMMRCSPLQKNENIIGVQGHLWSETVRTREQMDYMIFPRVLALAERAWHKAEFEENGLGAIGRRRLMRIDWAAFSKALGHKELSRLDDIGVKYRVPQPYITFVKGWVFVSSTFPGLPVQYRNNNTWIDVAEGWNNWGNNDQVSHWRTLSPNKARSSNEVEINDKGDRYSLWTIQPDIDYIADHVTVQLEVIDNMEKVKGDYITSRLQLRNTGTRDVRWGQWKIFFYSLYGVLQEDLKCGLSVFHENGGLFYFSPNKRKGTVIIGAGKTLNCIYHNMRWLVARTDHMPNWYVSSSGMVAKVMRNTVDESLSFIKGFNTAAKWKRTKDDKFNPYTPGKRFDMYKLNLTVTNTNNLTIIPTPMTISHDESIALTVSFESGWTVALSADFEYVSEYVAGKLNLPSRGNERRDKSIFFSKSSFLQQEEYFLKINTTYIMIVASSGQGAMHGAQTLISLIEGDEGRLTTMTISDKPRFSYRGVMLDVVRNFKPKRWIFKFLDTMSMYKLNTLHLHLTDDENWRIEIPGIPELTEMASYRCHSDQNDSCTLPQLGSGPDTSTYGSGYYSIQDYRDILQYARERYILIIPEIDLPGHSMAAITAMIYRETKIDKMKMHESKDTIESYLLSDIADNSVISVQRWTGNVINPCKPSTYTFIEAVLDELIALHAPIMPLSVFHMGGDEVPEGSWNISKACRGNISTRNMSTESLQRMFVKKVSKIVSARNLSLALVDDGVYAEGEPNPITDFSTRDVFVFPWDNRWELGKGSRTAQLANAGYKVVISLATHLYIDQQYEPDPEERGLYWSSRNTDTRKIFGLMPDNILANADVDEMGNPIDRNNLCDKKPCPTIEKPENVVGMQAYIWSETIRTEDHFHYMSFPRLLSYAERSWHKATWEDVTDRKARNDMLALDWDKFASRLGYKELPRLERNNIKYRLSPPGAKHNGERNVEVNTEFPQYQVEFSVDGQKTWLNVQGTSFKAPLTSKYIHLRTRSREGRTSRVINLEMP